MDMRLLTGGILVEVHPVSTQHPDASFEEVRNIKDERAFFGGEVFLRREVYASDLLHQLTSIRGQCYQNVQIVSIA